jgi:small redox-active disulfide protein 2
MHTLAQTNHPKKSCETGFRSNDHDKEINMLTIKVLGSGCANCKRVEQIARKVVTELAIEAEILKVTDYNEIAAYNVLSTPGLVVNEQLVSSGRIPSPAEVSMWVTSALESASA